MNIRIHLTAVLATGLLLAGGHALAQKCNGAIPDATPDSRYQANADGTVVDTSTGLMWMRCAMGQSWDAQNGTCTGDAATYTWQAALKAAQTLDQGSGYAGYTDWRLPNYRELTSLARFRCHDPAINETAFPATASTNFWSATPVAAAFNVAWTVDFGTGQAVYLSDGNDLPMRLVRAGAMVFP